MLKTSSEEYLEVYTTQSSKENMKVLAFSDKKSVLASQEFLDPGMARSL